MYILIMSYVYVYMFIYVYELRTKLYVKFDAIHKLGSSPIGYEGFVQPRKGQGKAKQN